MKIRSPIAPAPLEALRSPSTRPAGAVDAPTAPVGATTLSTPAKVVSELRDAAASGGRYGTIDTEKVAAIKKEIAAGTFGGTDDTERAIDALLEEL
jgi:anti-sigma28 factor (negative regulator of flagellin synthesis)